uniref:YqgF/RNase H-like domain-containing protein n=1 Tax=Aplanochytrium stocchinoi TaxID=215587 RepID=A0A7S3V205_9STRA|mmetsp:Transcript_478/g.564  ORF Transcript_478/g.564 Transcript_478/m.564 type:complete len:191 (-) Transcript_478:130-702(-)|eukprot:CAMPEP_0204828078 /NCGR_PEP_ID=MMETSP1346-20131115/5681_1 /ASSEMBLY_ACC=CAM_ASM_000771 /TAXON_ID=215587 /ORGANISM="Aplanochytrium stocchinoi, Strain GSBS06" /LENGTH=190 /DNA_ID=CAMNT_0051956867 /DNA_START=62 /DNA_END=634 /DNA_ORIENTATION=-
MGRLPWLSQNVLFNLVKTSANFKGTRILGVDVGTKLVGLSIADTPYVFASPLGVLDNPRLMTRIRADIQQIQKEYNVGTIVVGWPVMPDGRVSKQCRKVENFAKEAFIDLPNVPVTFWDERHTTNIAESIVDDLKADHGIAQSSWKKRSGKHANPYKNYKKCEKRKQNMDAIAAAVILQSFLDFHNNNDT